MSSPAPRSAVAFFRRPEDATPLYDAVYKTLLIELAPGFQRPVAFPLQPGTFEHVALPNLEQIALFLSLKGARSADTLRRYTAEVEKFLVFLKVENLPIINEWVLQRYQQNLTDPSLALRTNGVVTFNAVSPETADQYFNVIRSLVGFLADKQLLPINYAKLIRSQGISNKNAEHGRAFTEQQWQAVLATLAALPERTPGERNKKERLRFCILFGYALALRISEQRAHSHAHIKRSGDSWKLAIVGKGKRARNLTLTAGDGVAWDVLCRYRRHLKLPELPAGEPVPLLPRIKPVVVRRRGPRPGVFINAQPPSKSSWEDQFHTFLRIDVMAFLYGDDKDTQETMYNEEWKHLTPHSLRHTRITHLVNEGQDLLWVQKFAGHENLNTTARYYDGKI